MKTLRISLSFFVLFSVSLNSEAQLNRFKKFKDAVNKKVENLEKTTGKDIDLKQSFDKIRKAYADKDTANFNFAIAAIDNVSFFEDENNFKKLVKAVGVENVRNFRGNGGLNQLLDDDGGDNLSEDQVRRKALRLKTVGEVAFSSRKFKVAERAFNNAVATLEENGDPDPLTRIKVTGNLGLLYQAMGRFTLSEQYTQSAINEISGMTGEDSYSYASLLNNLSVLYKDQGKYSESEKLIEQSVGLLSEDGNASYYIALNNKAILYQALGRYDQSVEILEEVLAKPKRSRVRRSTTYQKIFINLALIYEARGEYEKAETIYKKAIEVKQEQWKKNHPDYAYLLTNLAALYLKMGKESEKVEKALLKALEINKDNFGSDHFVPATTRVYLGNYYRSIGKYDKAEQFLNRAFETRKNTYDPQHPLVLSLTEDLAILKWEQGRLNEATDLYRSVIDQTLDFIRNNFPSMSETEKTKFWNSQQGRFYRYFSYIMDAQSSNSGLLTHFFEIQLQTKGLLLSASTKIKQAILSGNDEELKLKYLEWIDLKENLSALYSYSNERLEEEEINLDSLERKSNELEKYLSESTDLFNQSKSAVKYSTLVGRLSQGEAIVDLVRFPEYKNGFTGEVIYAALVGKVGNVAPEVVFLKNGNDLESKFYKYYRNTTGLQIEDEYSYDNFWASIEPKLSGVQRVFVSKDGIYNQISLPTLVTENNEPLVNTKSFVLLTNSADLIGLKDQGFGKPASAFLLGYPTYGSPDISELPGTKVEVESIERILRGQQSNVTKVLEQQASESNLRSASDVDVIHVATHGFFLEDPSDAYSEKVFGINLNRMAENVFLRSGLMLSGAGVSEQSGDFASEDNGIATAYEILNYPLDNVEMVVLSACETGLGEIKAGEGVYGLQRSLLVAGANTLLMSLWKVDDQATKDFMTTFYSNWVKEGDKYAAFRSTQLAMSKKYESPYYWGAFVIMGR